MKRKACMFMMALVLLTSTLFAASSVTGTTLPASDATTKIGLDLKEADLSIYKFGFLGNGDIFQPGPKYDPNPLDKITLTLNEDKTAAENKNAGSVWYYFLAAKLPVLTIYAGEGLTNEDSGKVISYEIGIDGKTERSGDEEGVSLTLTPLDPSKFTSSGLLSFSIKTTTPFTPDMASELHEWTDTITLKLTSV